MVIFIQMIVVAVHVYPVIHCFTTGLPMSMNCLLNIHQWHLPWCSNHAVQELPPPYITIDAGIQQGMQMFVCIMEVYASDRLH